MCATCGCSSAAVVRLFPAGHEHEIGEHDSHEHPGHEHPGHEHSGHEHSGHEHSGHEHERTVQLQQKVLAKNDRLADANRDWLHQRGILAVNLMSSPGAGKTTLFNLISGLLRPDSGRVFFFGRDWEFLSMRSFQAVRSAPSSRSLFAAASRTWVAPFRPHPPATGKPP